MIISSSSHSLWLTEHAANGLVEAPFEVKLVTIVFSRCCQNLKFGNFTLSFGRLRQRVVLKSVPHVQHDYFSSFDQSDHCLLSSLLPLPSSLHKLLLAFLDPGVSVYYSVQDYQNTSNYILGSLSKDDGNSNNDARKQ